MNDTHPSARPDDPAHTPFGAGIPAEVVQPVRLAPGSAHGPALDVRGQSTPSTDPHGASTVSSSSPSFATAPAGAAGTAGAGAAGAGTFGSGTAGASAAGAGALGAGAVGAGAMGAGAAGASTASSTAAAGSPPPPPPPGAPPHAVPPQAPPPGAAPRSSAGRWWIGLAHLSFLIPFPPGVLITAALWIWRRDRDALMSDQGREALNMQLTFWLVIAILGASCLGSALVPFVYVLGAVLCILAAIAAGNGDRHRYPWVFRFLT